MQKYLRKHSMHMDKAYSTLIIPYLQLLGGFDPENIKQIEAEMLKRMKRAGLSLARYRRYKTDRHSDTPLYHHEAEFLHKFFVEYFEKTMKATDDERYKKTLEAWYPVSAMSLYWQPDPATAEAHS